MACLFLLICCLLAQKKQQQQQHIYSNNYTVPVIHTGQDMSKSVLVALLGLSLGLVTAFPSQQPDGRKHWVVIVAGSNGWYNYRHQVREGTVATLSPYLVQTVTQSFSFIIRICL